MAKIFRAFIFSVLLAGVAQINLAQAQSLIKKPQFQKDAQAAVDSLYNFNPTAAEKKLASWKKKYPSDPLWLLVNGVERWWNLISDLHDTSHDKQFIKMMKKADYQASKILYKHPGNTDALITHMGVNGYIARLYSDRDEWVKGLQAAQKAYKAYEKLQKELPDFPDLDLLKGLKLYYAAYLPEQYPVVKTVSWALPDGNKREGKKYLRKAAKTAIFDRAEAIYFLGNINADYEHQYSKAAGYFRQLYDQFPNNNYYARLLVKSNFKMGRRQEALQVINEALQRWKNKNLPFSNVLEEELYYWKGRILLNRGKTAQGVQLFRKSFALSNKLPRSKHRPFYTYSAYYLGEALMKSGQNDKAAIYFKKVLQAKTNNSFSDAARKRLREIGEGS